MVLYGLYDEGDHVRLTPHQDDKATEEEARHSAANWKMMLDGHESSSREADPRLRRAPAGY